MDGTQTRTKEELCNSINIFLFCFVLFDPFLEVKVYIRKYSKKACAVKLIYPFLPVHT